jgi:hypothetical protein
MGRGDLPHRGRNHFGGHNDFAARVQMGVACPLRGPHWNSAQQLRVGWVERTRESCDD